MTTTLNDVAKKKDAEQSAEQQAAAELVRLAKEFHFIPAGSEFTLIDLGGNDGGGTTGPWLASWELPNTITCDDRPPVVPPPPPSAW